MYRKRVNARNENQGRQKLARENCETAKEYTEVKWSIFNEGLVWSSGEIPRAGGYIRFIAVYYRPKVWF